MVLPRVILSWIICHNTPILPTRLVEKNKTVQFNQTNLILSLFLIVVVFFDRLLYKEKWWLDLGSIGCQERENEVEI